MKNKKGNTAVIAIIVVVAALAASIITWLIATKSQTSTQQAIIQPSKTNPSAQQNQTQTTVQQNSDKIVYQNTDTGYKITLPKEWKDYLVSDTGFDGNYELIKFYLPTTDENWSDLLGNNIRYGAVMNVEAYSLSYWNEKKNSAACKKDPMECPQDPYIKNNEYAYVISGTLQDAPKDWDKLYGKTFMIGLNFPENFNKYFKFELLGQ